MSSVCSIPASYKFVKRLKNANVSAQENAQMDFPLTLKNANVSVPEDAQMDFPLTLKTCKGSFGIEMIATVFNVQFGKLLHPFLVYCKSLDYMQQIKIFIFHWLVTGIYFL